MCEFEIYNEISIDIVKPRPSLTFVLRPNTRFHICRVSIPKFDPSSNPHWRFVVTQIYSLLHCMQHNIQHAISRLLWFRIRGGYLPKHNTQWFRRRKGVGHICMCVRKVRVDMGGNKWLWYSKYGRCVWRLSFEFSGVERITAGVSAVVLVRFWSLYDGLPDPAWSKSNDVYSYIVIHTNHHQNAEWSVYVPIRKTQWLDIHHWILYLEMFCGRRERVWKPRKLDYWLNRLGLIHSTYNV